MHDEQTAQVPPVSEEEGGAPVQPEAPAQDKAAELQAALDAAQQKAAQNWDSYLRAAAELDNLRKRTQRDLENAHKYALERFLIELLPVKDSLEMGLAAAGKAEAASLAEGMDMTLRLLSALLERAGVAEINPAKGEAFNPELHEAMSTQASGEVPADRVLMTVQKGYILNGRLLRPARVLVAKPPPAGAA